MRREAAPTTDTTQETQLREEFVDALSQLPEFRAALGDRADKFFDRTSSSRGKTKYTNFQANGRGVRVYFDSDYSGSLIEIDFYNLNKFEQSRFAWASYQQKGLELRKGYIIDMRYEDREGPYDVPDEDIARVFIRSEFDSTDVWVGFRVGASEDAKNFTYDTPVNKAKELLDLLKPVNQEIPHVKKPDLAPSHISSRLLKALGGRKEIVEIKGEEVALVNDGAYLWGEGDRDKGKGILNHVLLARRTALALATALKDKQAPGFENINLDFVADAATLHDVTKLYGEDREKLTVDQKRELGLPDNFREIMDDVDDAGVEWLSKLGFPVDVYGSIVGHDFPLRIVDDPYWKIVLVADYMSGQKIMTVEERLNDVKTRWIDQQIAKGEAPRIEPKRFVTAEQNIKAVASELFGAIGMADIDFIDVYDLNNPATMDRGEAFIRKTAGAQTEDRAKRAFGTLDRVAASGNYGKIGYHEWRAKNPKDKSSK